MNILDQDYFGTPEPPMDAKQHTEAKITEPPKIRIKHKSDPFHKVNRWKQQHQKNNPNPKKKLLRRPVSRVSADANPSKRSKFQGSGEEIKFVSRPGKNPHKVRISPNSVHHENKVYAKISANSDVLDEDVYKNTPTKKEEVSKIPRNRLLVPQSSPNEKGDSSSIFIESILSIVLRFQFQSKCLYNKL